MVSGNILASVQSGAIFHNSIVVVFVVVVCTCPQAMALAMITTRKSIHAFPLLSNMGMGLCLAAFWASSAPLISKINHYNMYASPGYLILTGPS